MAALVVVCTTALTLLTVRWLAPQLLGAPIDLQLVQSSKTVPPFFEGVFRDGDYATDKLLLNDPVTNVRFRPLLTAGNGTGPHDILGFRNTDIPDHPDVIAIGDSQTYGFGEPIQSAWPSQLAAMLGEANATVYSMAVGGWSATQYLHLASVAAKFRPRTLIIAFYSGNDALESFASAYGNGHWSSLRPDDTLDKSDAPAVGSMLDVKAAWRVRFRDGGRITFTPVGRLAANDDHPAVQAGYAIMAEAARRIAALAAGHDMNVVFTVIPTRELVYAQKVVDEELSPPESYRQLVTKERRHIDVLADHIRLLPGARYVDLLGPLQSAALGPELLYPRQWDGHPGAAGYRVIASSLAPAIRETLAK
jgi:lysophospholipase L1-like esterase